MAKSKARFTVESYKALEKRCRGHFVDALLARWDFGARLLEEREAHGGKQLPHRRLDELCKTCKLTRSEIQNRMQFAKEHPRKKVPSLLDTFGSWYKIVARGLGHRQEKQKRWASEVDHLLFDFQNLPATPRALSEYVADMTPEQMARARQASGEVRAELEGLERKMVEVERGRRPQAA